MNSLLLLMTVSLAASNPPEVYIKTGKLRGKWTKIESGRAVAAFEGVPYAKPPVASLRFQPPVPVEPWSGVKTADAVGSICPQRLNNFTSGSEDCLYLNVYAPETVSRQQPLPVMLFIHGGGFNSGAGSIYGPDYLLTKEVILVTFNYRLGPLGFLSTGDSVIPGNNAMKDMVVVLRWVKDNIRGFGGDPNKVTVFGESAGAASTSLLMLSQLSKGMFHRAIALSGSAMAPWAYHEPAEARRVANVVADTLGCSTDSSEQLKRCLLTKTAEDIISTDKAFVEWEGNFLRIFFMPTAEPSSAGAFLERHPQLMFKAGQIADVPFIIGFTSNEGCVSAASIVESPRYLEDFDQKYDTIAPIIFKSSHLPQAVSKKVCNQIRHFYFGDKAIEIKTKWELIDALSDFTFVHASMDTLKRLKKVTKSSVFMYELAHISNVSFATAYGAKNASYGVCHGDDLLYLFPVSSLLDEKQSAADKAFTRYLVNLFTTFADTGRPTADGSWQEVHHPECAEYMYLSEAGSSAMRQDYQPRRMNFWYTLPVNVAQAAPGSTGNVASAPCHLIFICLTSLLISKLWTIIN